MSELTLGEIQARMNSWRRVSPRLWANKKYEAVQMVQSEDGNTWTAMLDGKPVFEGTSFDAENHALALVTERLKLGYQPEADFRNGPKQRINFYADADVISWYQSMPEGGRARVINQAIRDFIQKDKKEAESIKTLLTSITVIGTKYADQPIKGKVLLDLVKDYEQRIFDEYVFPSKA